LSHYSDLSNSDRTILQRFEQDEHSYQAGEKVHRSDDVVKHLYIVKEGWLYSYTDLADGRRHIVRIHHPGDVLGIPEVAFDRATMSLQAANNVVLCPFPKAALAGFITTAPRLTALLFSLAMRDQVVLADQLRAIARMNASERVSFLLMDLISRLRIADTQVTNEFHLPLNQHEIGDCLGLTNVYVSKTLRLLEERKLIDRDGQDITLIDEPGLIEMSGFVNRYTRLDTNWFPALNATMAKSA